MIQNNENLFEQAIQLPVPQRMSLVAKLLDSFAGVPDTDVEQAWALDLKRRIDEADQGNPTFISWEDARRMIVEDCNGTSSS